MYEKVALFYCYGLHRDDVHFYEEALLRDSDGVYHFEVVLGARAEPFRGYATGRELRFFPGSGDWETDPEEARAWFLDRFLRRKIDSEDFPVAPGHYLIEVTRLVPPEWRADARALASKFAVVGYP